MKALLLYSRQAGRKDFARRIPVLRRTLAKTFEVLDIVCTFSMMEASRLEEKACGVYDALIIVGGDGTFNNAVNVPE